MTPAHQSHYARIADLEAENAWLRAELGYRESVAGDLQQAFGLGPARAAILGALYAARGRWVLGDTLDGLSEHNNKYRRAALAVHLHFLRRMFGRDMIQTSGYGDSMAVRILPPVMTRVEVALADNCHD